MRSKNARQEKFWMAFKEMHNYFEYQINFACEMASQPSVVVRYSAYRTDHEGVPIDNLDKRAIRGRVRVVEEHDPFWGEGRRYTSRVMEDPTWLQLCVVANAQMLTTGDLHHSFLEGITRTGKKEADGTSICRLIMGS